LIVLITTSKANVAFSHLIRQLVDSVRLDNDNSRRVVEIDKIAFSRLINLLRSWDNTTIDEIAQAIGISKRTIFKVVHDDSGYLYVTIQKKTLDRVVEYAYEKAEIVEKSPF